MGWNKRSSGHKYNSISGHGFLMGEINTKILIIVASARLVHNAPVPTKRRGKLRIMSTPETLMVPQSLWRLRPSSKW